MGILIFEMLTGFDPFTAEDPLDIYANVLRGKFLFPKNFDGKAKSLVKHLLVADLSKRYGNLKKGVNDIKNHRFFKEIDWLKLVEKRMKAP